MSADDTTTTVEPALIVACRSMLDGTASVWDTDIDMQTANVIVTVYDKLSATNQAKLGAMSPEQAAAVCWRLVA